jgi:DNA-binding response OmpR family regulator
MKRVLLIEDDRDIVELVRYNLEREGFQVAAATDGASGLAQIRKTPPDILLLDLMLPKLSGLDICKEIRRDTSLNRLPILMLTARGDPADRIAGLELGADDYLPKPFEPRELMGIVGQSQSTRRMPADVLPRQRLEARVQLIAVGVDFREVVVHIMQTDLVDMILNLFAATQAPLDWQLRALVQSPIEFRVHALACPWQNQPKG